MSTVEERREIRREKNELAAQRFEDGWSLREISAIDGRTHEGIRQMLLTKGVEMRSVGKKAPRKEGPVGERKEET